MFQMALLSGGNALFLTNPLSKTIKIESGESKE
jgi:hypothetical protein